MNPGNIGIRWKGAKRQTRRWLFLMHRWFGIGLSLFIALWFVSGIVMLYVGYPQLTATERLARLTDLRSGDCCVSLAAAWQALPLDADVSSITLSNIGGRPVYVFAGGGAFFPIDAETAEQISNVSRHAALRSGAGYATGVGSTYVGLVQEDIWTRGNRLDPHRPLHRVELDDRDGTLLYISSSTGEVVRDAPLIERRLSFVGAWLHWIHAFRANEPAWRVVVITLSILGTALAITGTVVGIMQWKFRGRFRSGARTPYREFYLRWHHVIGMLFAAVTIMWMFSGLMSMNPFKVLASHAPPLEMTAYAGGPLAPGEFHLEAPEMLRRLPDGFSAREIEWKLVGGHPWLIAYDSAGEVLARAATADPADTNRGLTEEEIIAVAGRLVPGARLRDVRRLNDYDFWYYPRASHTMFGNLLRPLPVLKFAYDDAERTIVYVDPRSGGILATFDQAERRARLLFRLLHSWDLPVLLAARPLWDLLMLFFLAGGLALGATGMVIGVRRLRASVRKARRWPS